AGWGDVRWAQPGLFNARNAAMAATAAALAIDPQQPTALSLEPLARFRGVRRRQEALVTTPALTVIEDFGHHPTALAETLTSFRARFSGARLTAVFEPRSNTARTKALQPDFTRALALADEVYIGAVNRADKLRADQRFDADEVLSDLTARGRQARTAATNGELLAMIQEDTLPPADNCPRVVIFFSNGSFDGIIGSYAAAAQSHAS